MYSDIGEKIVNLNLWKNRKWKIWWKNIKNELEIRKVFFNGGEKISLVRGDIWINIRII